MAIPYYMRNYGDFHAPYMIYIGLDLGQVNDYTALAFGQEAIFIDASNGLYDHVVGLPDWVREAEGGVWVMPMDLPASTASDCRFIEARHQGRPVEPPFLVSELHRYPLGTGYDVIKREVMSLMGKLSGYHPVLVMDKTGVGAPVADDFHVKGFNTVPVWLTNGGSAHWKPGANGLTMHAPVRDVVSATKRYFYDKRLKLPPNLPYRKQFEHELQNFKRKINPETSNENFSAWRESDHDDILFAVSLIAFLRYWENNELDDWFRENGPVNPVLPGGGWDTEFGGPIMGRIERAYRDLRRGLR
jgi:hypothetical protein